MNIIEEKILNVIKFFTLKTKNVGRTKLFKLLYFADFEHFKKTGYSITGLDYYTFPFGPVPKELYDKISSGDIPEFLQKDITFYNVSENDESDKYPKFKVVPKNRKINWDIFTPRERKTLEKIAEVYRNASASQMTKISHWKDSPWDKLYKPNKPPEKIDYFLILDGEEPLDKETIKERFEWQRGLMSSGRV